MVKAPGRVALPQSVKHWPLTTLRDKLVKIGAKVVIHARYVMFQMAEVAISRQMFKTILRPISRLGQNAKQLTNYPRTDETTDK